MSKKVLYKTCDIKIAQESDGVYIYGLSLERTRCMVQIRDRKEANSIISALKRAEFK